MKNIFHMLLHCSQSLVDLVLEQVPWDTQCEEAFRRLLKESISLSKLTLQELSPISFATFSAVVLHPTLVDLRVKKSFISPSADKTLVYSSSQLKRLKLILVELSNASLESLFGQCRSLQSVVIYFPRNSETRVDGELVLLNSRGKEQRMITHMALYDLPHHYESKISLLTQISPHSLTSLCLDFYQIEDTHQLTSHILSRSLNGLVSLSELKIEFFPALDHEFLNAVHALPQLETLMLHYSDFVDLQCSSSIPTVTSKSRKFKRLRIEDSNVHDVQMVSLLSFAPSFLYLELSQLPHLTGSFVSVLQGTKLKELYMYFVPCFLKDNLNLLLKTTCETLRVVHIDIEVYRATKDLLDSMPHVSKGCLSDGTSYLQCEMLYS
jgi:hypothetical protein